MNGKLVFFFLSFFILSTSCVRDKTNRFDVRMNGDLQRILVDYLNENRVDRTRKVIVTEWVVNRNAKTEIYITNMNSDLYKNQENTPSYYSVLDEGIVVFVYTNIEGFVIRDVDTIIDELDNVLFENKVQLKKDSGLEYSAPTWLYTSCAGGETSITKTINPQEYSYVPCGYRLLQEGSKWDSLFIVKQ